MIKINMITLNGSYCVLIYIQATIKDLCCMIIFKYNVSSVKNKSYSNKDIASHHFSISQPRFETSINSQYNYTFWANIIDVICFNGKTLLKGIVLPILIFILSSRKTSLKTKFWNFFCISWWLIRAVNFSWPYFIRKMTWFKLIH